MITISCPICGQLNYTDVKTIVKNLNLNIGICKNDGMVWMYDRWSEEEYLKYYTEKYDYDYRPRSVIERVATEPDLQAFTDLYNRLEKYLPRKNVLDIGTGSGSSLIRLRNENPSCNLYAIESSKKCIKALQDMNVSIISEDMESEFSGPKMDLIILRHTLEHSMDPVRLLKRSVNLLNDGGIIYIDVPNTYKPLGSLVGDVFRIPHTYYFNEETLEYTAYLSGLERLDKSNGLALWAIFKKSSKDYKIELPDTYQKQFKILGGK